LLKANFIIDLTTIIYYIDHVIKEIFQRLESNKLRIKSFVLLASLVLNMSLQWMSPKISVAKSEVSRDHSVVRIIDEIIDESQYPTGIELIRQSTLSNFEAVNERLKTLSTDHFLENQEHTLPVIHVYNSRINDYEKVIYYTDKYGQLKYTADNISKYEAMKTDFDYTPLERISNKKTGIMRVGKVVGDETVYYYFYFDSNRLSKFKTEALKSDEYFTESFDVYERDATVINAQHLLTSILLSTQKVEIDTKDRTSGIDPNIKVVPLIISPKLPIPNNARSQIQEGVNPKVTQSQEVTPSQVLIPTPEVQVTTGTFNASYEAILRGQVSGGVVFIPTTSAEFSEENQKTIQEMSTLLNTSAKVEIGFINANPFNPNLYQVKYYASLNQEDELVYEIQDALIGFTPEEFNTYIRNPSYNNFMYIVSRNDNNEAYLTLIGLDLERLGAYAKQTNIFINSDIETLTKEERNLNIARIFTIGSSGVVFTKKLE